MARKKRKIEEDEGNDIGLIMTVSLFLILLTFFILLNSIAVIDERRERKALASLVGAFGSLTGGLSPSKSGDALIPPSAPMESDTSNLANLLSMMDTRIVKHIQVQTPPHVDKEIITISADVLFKPHGTIFLPTTAELLNRLGAFIKTGDFPVEIIGHADILAAQNKHYDSNWELSSMMATVVLRYFAEQNGVAAKRLTAYGRGSLWPLSSNATPEARIGNSRIEIIFNYDAPAYVKRLYREKPRGIFTYKRFNFKVFNR